MTDNNMPAFSGAVFSEGKVIDTIGISAYGDHLFFFC